jgi:hypothetical protein
MYTFQRIVKALYWLLFGSAAQKRRTRQELARLSASFFGDFPLSEDHKLWRTDKDFLADYAQLSPHNPYSQDRKFTLREFARCTGRLNGAIAECGCYEGASAYYLAKTQPACEIHLFDSFEGLSAPSTLDAPQVYDNPEWNRGDLRADEEKVRNRLRAFPNVKIHKGWIPEVLDVVTESRFRLVHIDVDLYQPTLDSLRFFYSRMNPGGVIILDDYGFTNCPGAFKATREFMRDKPECVIHLPTGQGVIIKDSP